MKFNAEVFVDVEKSLDFMNENCLVGRKLFSHHCAIIIRNSEKPVVIGKIRGYCYKKPSNTTIELNIEHKIPAEEEVEEK